MDRLLGQARSGLFRGGTIQVGAFLFHFLQFLLEHLILYRWFLAPWLALGFPLGCVSRYLPTVNSGEALRLALKFGAQFVFRHVVDLY
ncbi:hypothetical protein BAY1663_03874 [Pseudomonas sp. BAY1663]|nr:hypothetical protein BAY1663_03874 [Pseudomonas sp. BAY1663]